MFAALGLMTCPNLAVSPQVMSHIVSVESGANPYAIGVVGGQLERQPENLAEALATVHMLDEKGYNYSLGVAQVNRANLGKYGLDSYEKAFDTCSNLTAGAKILAACYTSSGGNWGKAFSCYYSGNFVTGYRDGYVQKVYDSINRAAGLLPTNADTSRAIPLKPASQAAPAVIAKAAKLAPNDSGYRVAIRSVAFYTTTASMVPAKASSSSHPTEAAPSVTPAPSEPAPSQSAATNLPTSTSELANSAPSTAPTSSIFVPQVTGPNDPAPQSAHGTQTAATQMASAPAGAVDDNVNPNQERPDAAFVF